MVAPWAVAVGDWFEHGLMAPGQARNEHGVKAVPSGRVTGEAKTSMNLSGVRWSGSAAWVTMRTKTTTSQRPRELQVLPRRCIAPARPVMSALSAVQLRWLVTAAAGLPIGMLCVGWVSARLAATPQLPWSASEWLLPY